MTPSQPSSPIDSDTGIEDEILANLRPPDFGAQHPTSDAAPDVPLIPARMVNEYVYCPRLAYLMWSQDEWAETADTVDGTHVHRRADRPGESLPDPDRSDTEYRFIVSRSIMLSSTALGVVAKIDVAEMAGGAITVVDYKRGKRPHVAQGVYSPERVQLCLQAMLLEEHGYRVVGGSIYFAESRERVGVEFDGELRALAVQAVEGLRKVVTDGAVPEPLVDSPKCPRCALVTVCLPDEVNWLSGSRVEPRPIAVPADEAFPLIVQATFAQISKDGDRLKIAEEGQNNAYVRLLEVSDVGLFGNVGITTPALTALMERDIPVTFHSYGGWFRGMTQGVGHHNVEVRSAQYRASFDPAFCLKFARSLVGAKIINQRTILRRNWRGPEEGRREPLARLTKNRRNAARCEDASKLLGIEGDSAATYFRAFSGLLDPPAPPPGREVGDGLSFQFNSRSRRPPTDPVNAMLSLAYAMLTRHLTITLASVGLDPFRGFYHQPRFGRPALSLDIMEPFRPIICDSVVLFAVNTGEIRANDFVRAKTGVNLTTHGRRRFIEIFERRLSLETTHPLFGYRLSMRRLLIVQARLLTRFLLGELSTYPHYLPR